jgi:acetolactate synthase regulatory subunit
MNINLNISMNNAEGALIRILGTIERRGHKLLGLRCRVPDPGDDIQELLVDVNCGERSPDVLMRQLDRLHDVISISRLERSEAIPDPHHLSFHAALPSSSGHIEPIRSPDHD